MNPSGRSSQLETRFFQCLLCLASLAVPRSRQAEWRREWQAELFLLPPATVRNKPASLRLTSLASGITSDAALLGLDSLRARFALNNSRGSAGWCLQTLAVLCVACLVPELLLAGSWHAFHDAIASHFFGCFLYVVLPGVVVAFSTSPTRPRRCDSKHSRLVGILSANARWNLFLAAKVLLTLVWGFLVSAAITALAFKLIGHYADWIELLSTALAIILGLRWALLNQEHRCQHCLRMLSRPTRVGFASRNFLDWNGTELICAEGHGLLHVTQMEGSWCWYDLWVELDPTWHGLFSA